jgi:hypothetical protein
MNIRTDQGWRFAREEAERRAGKAVHIVCIYFVRDQPGFCDYVYSTTGSR